MPHSCAALSCSQRCTAKTRSQGITFHRFPKDDKVRQQWEAALRRNSFTATPSSRLCSAHFIQEDFDRTGQTVRLRAGAVPSLFNLPAHLPMPVAAGESQPQTNLSEDPCQPVQERDSVPEPGADHSYALPTSPNDLWSRLGKAMARVESLEREKRNAKERERRARNIIRKLVEDLKGKDLINAELKQQLDLCLDKSKHM
eukprot:XP_011618374.1 PREDICTED: THAP domain-containing protein 6-like [Takifugu rubripes]